MYNSPTTPRGATAPTAVSAYTCAFAMGRPSATLADADQPSAGDTNPLTAVAASAGPYRLYSCVSHGRA
jgi:hypothetical protein